MSGDEKIRMAHGSGGLDSAELMERVFKPRFGNETLARLEDSAVVDTGSGRIAVSTDSFVVTPLVFPGGDIGKLAATGTINDVLMSGATPKYLTCGFVIEAGLSISLLDSICASLANVADEAGVSIIAGDTKVIEGRGESGGLIINTTGVGVFEEAAVIEGRGEGGGLIINTTGAGVFEEAAVIEGCGESGGLIINTTGAGVFEETAPECVPNTDCEKSAPQRPTADGIRPGDVIIVSGNLGDHHAAILSARMGIKNDIESDCALLAPITEALRTGGVNIHSMRDVTRGGLATVLNELAIASGVDLLLEESRLPVNPAVKAFCGIMGLDPLYMGNEGKVVMAVAPEDAKRALACIRGTLIGKNAAIIGEALFSADADADAKAMAPQGRIPLSMRTRLGGNVRLDVLYGEGLPRIC